jgi:pilus assembly protein CpaD
MKNLNMFFPRSTMIGLIFFASAALSGCVSDDIANDDLASPAPYSGSGNFPIVVAKGPVILDVASTHGTLQPTQINEVIGFAHQAMSTGLKPLTISRPSGGGASARVANEIAALLTQQGVSRQMLRITTYHAAASAPVNISYVTTYAKTKPCGQWPEDVTVTSSNQHFASYGCAVQANIAAMIDKPETLVVPATADPISAASRVVAIKKLEADTTTTSSTFSFF